MDAQETIRLLDQWHDLLTEHPDAPLPGQMIVGAYRACLSLGAADGAAKIRASVQMRADQGDEEYALILTALEEWTP